MTHLINTYGIIRNTAPLKNARTVHNHIDVYFKIGTYNLSKIQTSSIGNIGINNNINSLFSTVFNFIVGHSFYSVSVIINIKHNNYDMLLADP